MPFARGHLEGIFLSLSMTVTFFPSLKLVCLVVVVVAVVVNTIRNLKYIPRCGSFML